MKDTDHPVRILFDKGTVQSVFILYFFHYHRIVGAAHGFNELLHRIRGQDVGQAEGQK